MGSTSRTRRVVAALGVLAVAPAALLAATTSRAGAADAVGTPLVKSNWFYDDPQEIGRPVVGAPAMPTPTGVPAMDLGVGYRQGEPASAPGSVTVPAEADKVTMLGFDLSALPPGSTVGTFTIAVPVDTGDAASMALVTSPSAPLLVACAVGRSFDSGQGPTGFGSKPQTNCTGATPVPYDPATMSYRFDITQLAQTWVDDVNTGVSIEPDPATTASFTLALKPPASVTSMATGTSAAAPTTAPSPADSGTTTAPPARSTAAPTTLAPAATSAAATAAGVLPPPAGPGGSAPVPVAPAGGGEVLAAPAAPVVADAAPQPVAAAAEPVVAPVQTGPVAGASALRPAASVHVTGGVGALPWLLGVLVLIGLGAISLGLSAPPQAGSRARSSRLARLLDSGTPQP